MKDIQLKKNKDGDGYDWNFNGLDVETVIGEQQIINAVLHNIMLHNNELEMEIYADKGCSIYDHLPTINNSSSHKMLEEILLVSVNETEGVRESRIESKLEKDRLKIINLYVTLENGKEVRINGI